MIGCFADLTFEVNSDYVLTFDNFKHDVKARYARHELINRPTVLEYLGEDTQKITLTILLTASLGVNPAEEISRVQELVLIGEADYLIVANEVVGNCMWVITESSTKATAYDGDGNILSAQMDLTFEQYEADL